MELKKQKKNKSQETDSYETDKRSAVRNTANNDVIALRLLRSLRGVRCVGWKPRLT